MSAAAISQQDPAVIGKFHGGIAESGVAVEFQCFVSVPVFAITAECHNQPVPRGCPVGIIRLNLPAFHTGIVPDRHIFFCVRIAFDLHRCKIGGEFLCRFHTGPIHTAVGGKTFPLTMIICAVPAHDRAVIQLDHTRFLKSGAFIFLIGRRQDPGGGTPAFAIVIGIINENDPAGVDPVVKCDRIEDPAGGKLYEAVWEFSLLKRL